MKKPKKIKIDDNLFESERKVLRDHGCEDKYVFIDLKKNPSQLDQIIWPR